MQKSTKRQSPLAVFTAFVVALLMAFSAVPAQALAEIVSVEDEGVQDAVVSSEPGQIVGDESGKESPVSQESQSKESAENESTEEGLAKEEAKEEETVKKDAVEEETAERETTEREATEEEAVEEELAAQDGTDMPSRQKEAARVEDAIDEAAQEPVASAQDEVEDKENSDAIVEVDAQKENPMKVSYAAHMQYSGWMDFVSDGATAGITGKSLRMEGVKILLDKGDETLGGGIECRMHMQRHGWGGWSRNGAVGGVVGEALRMEALQVRLDGLRGKVSRVLQRACPTHGLDGLGKGRRVRRNCGPGPARGGHKDKAGKGRGGPRARHVLRQLRQVV